MSKPQRKINLFNCDHIYELRVVADFLNTAKQKHDFDLLVEEHYFSLPQISELSEKIIPELQMDFAVFVVHAHESRLSINEDDCGYYKVYRALLQATGGNVIIVIGGDDSYKDEDEEDKELISRWARRKIYLQFSEEFIDGRKSFIFSWNKKHREIHEKALLHFLDPSKKGLKFEYQPPTKRQLPPKSITPPPVRPSESEASSRSYFSIPERLYSGERVQSTKPVVPVESRAHRIGDQGARPKENRSSSTETTKDLKGLSVLGLNANQDSLSAVTQMIHKQRDILNLSSDPDVLNLAVNDMISYLENNPLKYCVLVVDAEKVKAAREQERPVDFLRLLQTAESNVAEKIIITVCCPRSLSEKDGSIVNRTIEESFNDDSKVYVTWFINGKLELTADDFIVLLTSAIKNTEPCPQHRSGATQIPSFETNQSVYAQENAVSGASRDIGYNNAFAVTSHGSYPHGKTEDHPLKPPNVSFDYKIFLPTGKIVLVDTRLHGGNISKRPEDVRYWMPGFNVPVEIVSSLLNENSKNPNAELVILFDEEERFVCRVDKKRGKEWQEFIFLALDETVVLQTRLKYGRISFESKDVVIHYQNWHVPQEEVNKLMVNYQATPAADLFVVSDSKGNARVIVQVGSVRKFFTFINKTVGKNVI